MPLEKYRSPPGSTAGRSGEPKVAETVDWPRETFLTRPHHRRCRRCRSDTSQGVRPEGRARLELAAGRTFVRVGVLVHGDTAVRAAHSLSAHPSVDDVVVIGPARSKSFEVVPDATGCDVLIASGAGAPDRAREHGLPLIWDGETAEPGVSVFGASPQGLVLALADREPDPSIVAVAHPDLESADGHSVRFPDPVGTIDVADSVYGGKRLAIGHSADRFAACLAVGGERRVTIVDDGPFMSGIALAAGLEVLNETPGPVWDHALAYLNAATEMGLVMGAA